MSAVLVRLLVLGTLAQLGISVVDSLDPVSWSQLQRASHKVISIDWKPISVFPEEAKRFTK